MDDLFSSQTLKALAPQNFLAVSSWAGWHNLLDFSATAPQTWQT
jgi:hypothetical protein